MTRTVLSCTAVAAFACALACGKSSQAPTSPSPASTADSGAAADGSTLKVSAPSPVSPANGAQPDTLVLIATKSQGKYADVALSYQFQIRSGSDVTYDSGVTPGVGSGPSNVLHTPSIALTPDTAFTWRARAAYQGAFGPWSADASFKSPVGGFIRDNELYDPLIGGRTVGTVIGPVQFTSEGAKLLAHESVIRYQLPA